MDVNEELKFLGNFTQKKLGGGVAGGVWVGGVRVVGGQGGCERKIEVFGETSQKKNSEGWGGGWGGGSGWGGQGGCE